MIVGYCALRENIRIYFLVLASLFFYAWGERAYVLVMLLSIAINYVFGLLIHLVAPEARAYHLRKIFLFLAIAGNLGILFYFKYLNFTLEGISSLLHEDYVYKDIALPIGISFFTFQGMSYIIDLYFKRVKVQKNPAYVAFYISFFPQLMAGPIVRYSQIADQIYAREESFEKFSAGAKRFILGLSKKVIIANTLGYVADQVFANPAVENTAATAWLGILCYTFQIFFDFSGYSDMAIGIGKMFGFVFPENFNYPYISKTITEFWRRWHMSLSSWFRDYLYIPLGGNRSGNVYANLLIVFAVTGFWHGASFSFVFWGLWHGLFLMIERVSKSRVVEKRRLIPLRYVATMAIVIVGWVFFRVEELPEAMRYVGIMFGLVRPENDFTALYYINNKMIVALIIAIIASTPMLKEARFLEKIRHSAIAGYASSAMHLALFFVCIVFVVSSSYNPFIYFRF